MVTNEIVGLTQVDAMFVSIMCFGFVDSVAY